MSRLIGIVGRAQFSYERKGFYGVGIRIRKVVTVIMHLAGIVTKRHWRAGAIMER